MTMRYNLWGPAWPVNYCPLFLLPLDSGRAWLRAQMQMISAGLVSPKVLGRG